MFDTFSDFESQQHITAMYKVFLKTLYIQKDIFTLNIKDTIYTKHYLIISTTVFRYNYRFFGLVMSENDMITYYSGRELMIQETKDGNKITKSKLPVDEIILKTIFAGLNSYKVLNSQNIVHFLKFSPVFLYNYKYILNAIKFFFDLNEVSLRFTFLQFKESEHIFKKIRAIKKNLKKKNATKSRKDDYGLVIL